MREYRLVDMNQLGRADLSAEVFAITRLYTQIRYGRVAIDAGRLSPVCYAIASMIFSGSDTGSNPAA